MSCRRCGYDGPGVHGYTTPGVDASACIDFLRSVITTLQFNYKLLEDRVAALEART